MHSYASNIMNENPIYAIESDAKTNFHSYDYDYFKKIGVVMFQWLFFT